MLRVLLSSTKPDSFAVPIPTQGVFREMLSTIAASAELEQLGHNSAWRGTYADEMFIYAAAREEFEIVLIDLTSTQFYRDQGREF